MKDFYPLFKHLVIFTTFLVLSCMILYFAREMPVEEGAGNLHAALEPMLAPFLYCSFAYYHTLELSGSFLTRKWTYILLRTSACLVLLPVIVWLSHEFRPGIKQPESDNLNLAVLIACYLLMSIVFDKCWPPKRYLIK